MVFFLLFSSLFSPQSVVEAHDHKFSEQHQPTTVENYENFHIATSYALAHPRAFSVRFIKLKSYRVRVRVRVRVR